MEVIFNSFLLVAVTEMGDKTQLLALVLSSRYKKPLVIMTGVLVATLLNHSLASFVGVWVANSVSGEILKWILAVAFFAFAVWVLMPDKDESSSPNRFGAFFTTLVAFFFVEMGDKTQLSTIALAAQYKNFIVVTIGTTLGMLFSDGLAVFLGEKVNRIVPMKVIRYVACLLFIVFGLLVLKSDLQRLF